MRYAGIIKNDIAAAPGVCVTFFTQGCPHHCPGCHNPETWDFDGGKEFNTDIIDEVINALQANGVHRDLCIMGGEPLCPDNQFLTAMLMREVKAKLPNTKMYIWTGYEFSDLKTSGNRMQDILNMADCIIDGPFIQTQRDITLWMRGSKNQKIWTKESGQWEVKSLT